MQKRKVHSSVGQWSRPIKHIYPSITQLREINPILQWSIFPMREALVKVVSLFTLSLVIYKSEKHASVLCRPFFKNRGSLFILLLLILTSPCRMQLNARGQQGLGYEKQHRDRNSQQSCACCLDARSPVRTQIQPELQMSQTNLAHLKNGLFTGLSQ